MATVRFHHDSDGIISGYFTAYGLGPETKLDGWDGKFGDTTGLVKGDYMVDMRPIQNMEGLNVIDHHLPHREDRKYNLIADNVPASLICWRHFKESIPKNEWWKVAIGLVGDGQPELIPTEVFEQCPQLLIKSKTSAYKSYGKWSIGYYPAYKLLSSNVNAFLRKHDFKSAMDLVRTAQSPKDILNSAKAKTAKKVIAAEYERLVKESVSYEFDNLVVFIYYSALRMAGYLASSLQNSFNGKTIMVINGSDGTGSLRGDLSYYWRDKLNNLDYIHIDGHPGFCGLSISGNPNNLIEDISLLLNSP